MKRLSLFILTLIYFVGCNYSNVEDNYALESEGKEFYASFAENDQTRTFADEQLRLLWTKGDLLSIFTSTLNEKYKFDGETGDNSGTFTKVNTGQFGSGNSLPNNYGIYPYSSSNKISNDGIITLSLPAKQYYAEKSFGVGANTMVAVTADSKDYFLPLKAVGGFLKLRLYSSQNVSVKKIRFSGNNGEKIAGLSTVYASYSQDPEIEVSAEGTSTITLDCGNGIALGSTSSDVIDFWLVVPPTVFTGGFTISVVDTNDMVFKMSTSKQREITRNTILAMPALDVIPTEKDTFVDEEGTSDEQPNNEIWYTSVNDRYVIPEVSSSAFGANIVSYSYVDGKGVIKFDDDVIAIGDNAFNGTPLKTISLPQSVTYIGEEAFGDCEDLETINFPEGLTSIGYDAFYDCVKLTEINLPESLTYIGNYAFCECEALDNVVLPKGLKQLNSGVFSGCESLKTITLPEGLLSIGDSAFYGCSFTDIKIPDSVISIGGSVFGNCDGLTDLVKINGVNYISEGMYGGCDGFTSITIPDNITNIDEEAFYNCENLKEVVLPNGLTKISDRMFESSGIESINIPASVTTIGSHAFGNCINPNFEVIVIPNSVTTIGEGAFYGCKYLCDVTLSNSITEIADDLFAYSGIEDIDIPESVTTIGRGAFAGSDLFSITIPDNVTSFRLSTSEEWDDEEEKYVEISYATTFRDCENLYEVTLGNGIKEIPNGLFQYMNRLRTVNLGESITVIGDKAFEQCNRLESITIPNSVTTIGNEAFSVCPIIELVIPDKVTTIGRRAFADSGIVKLTLGSSVATIGDSAFTNYSLTEVYSKSVTPPVLGSYVFNSDYYEEPSLRLYVPSAAKTAYETSEWAQYFIISEYAF